MLLHNTLSAESAEANTKASSAEQSLKTEGGERQG